MEGRNKFVIDTSAFLTEDMRKKGEDAEEAINRLLGLIEEAGHQDVSVMIPPSTKEELVDILENMDVSEETMDDLDAFVVLEPPSRYEVKIPGEMLYKFIDEMRDRVNKGLRLSEKAVRKNLEDVEDPENEHITRKDVIISKLRDDYKESLRKGIVDSKEDLDILLLAGEKDATVVTEDKGIINWADDLGLRYIKGRDFPEILEKRLE